MSCFSAADSVSIPEIIKDIDCLQETQQHAVTIEHNWSIGNICELIQSKRPGEKIESEQFSFAFANDSSSTSSSSSSSSSSSQQSDSSDDDTTSNHSRSRSNSSSNSNENNKNATSYCKYCVNNCLLTSGPTTTSTKTDPPHLPLNLTLIPTSYSLNFELACDYFINNCLWRLEINRSVGCG